MPSGFLPANRWTQVITGWGWYSVAYSLSSSAPGGKYRIYPFYSSGDLPNPYVDFTVRGYGDIWLYSPVEATWTATPVSH